jgi:hypothetical protein
MLPPSVVLVPPHLALVSSSINAKAIVQQVNFFQIQIDNSWLPDQRSQARNALVSCDLILPNGKIRTISESSDPELFSALKSGFNDYVGVQSSLLLK